MRKTESKKNTRQLLHKRMITLLIFITIFTFSILDVFAQEPYSNTEYAVSLDIIAYPGTLLQSNNNESSAFGHAFLVVHNANSYSIRVGHMTIPSRGAVTIGTFGNRAKHTGVWYNIEGYYSSVVESENSAKLSTRLTQAELTTLNQYINNYDDHADLSNNCAHFSKRCWNAVSDVTLTGGTPMTLRASILNNGGSTSGINIPNKSINDIAYQTTSSIIYDTSGAYAN